MLAAPALQSIGLIAIFIWSLLQVQFSPFQVAVRRDLINQFNAFWNHPEFWTLTLWFFIVLISSLWSTDWSYWTERLRIKLPFLLLPFAFFLLPPFSRKAFRSLVTGMLLLTSLVAAGVLINYFLHFETVNLMIRRGQHMPMPLNHIRFSLLIGLVILYGLHQVMRGQRDLQWRLQLGLSIFLILFLHLLSVRTGLLAFYAALGLGILRFIWSSKRYALGAILITGMLATPLAAYWLLPSFRTKINYMRWEMHLRKHQNEAAVDYSDAGRILSWKIGWDLFTKHPLIGVGAGDLRREVNSRYKDDYPNFEQRRMPHNQFLSVLAGTGIIGFVFFTWGMLGPLLYQKGYREELFPLVCTVLWLSFMVENTVENALGVAIYVLFLGLILLQGKISVGRTPA